MANGIMKQFNMTLKSWILIAVALLILFALSAQPCLAGLMWSG
jgi:hypothetical protein